MLNWPRFACLRRRRCAVAVLAVTLLVVVAIQLERMRRDAVARAQGLECNGHLSGLGGALFQYQQRTGHLPPGFVTAPDGARMHSWRALAAEELGTNYKFPSPYNLDEPWNGPNNSKLGDARPRGYACPSDPNSQLNRRLTNYFVIDGTDTAFPGSRTKAGVRPGDPSLSNTILFAEASRLNIEWLEPRDLEYGTMSFALNDPTRPGISSVHPQGANACMADGSVRFLHNISPEVLRGMLEAKGRGWQESAP
jgi:prepilin-type processing-associated H-X9-DG protein